MPLSIHGPRASALLTVSELTAQPQLEHAPHPPKVTRASAGAEDATHPINEYAKHPINEIN